jgi:hypothetical protein
VVHIGTLREKRRRRRTERGEWRWGGKKNREVRKQVEREKRKQKKERR